MDLNLNWGYEKLAQRVIKNLEKNNMEGYYVKDEKEAVAKLEELLSDGQTVSVGGSMTLFETGVIDFLRSGKYVFLDRYEEGLKPEDLRKIYKQSFFADAYITSTNALTQNGELYNVDGNGNRVAAMLYGPDSVIVITGINKIVRDVDAAVKRVEDIAAPVNMKRLNRNTPCAETGHCHNCNSTQRACNEYVLIKRQGVKGRIKVIIVGKELGY
jgi:L-lactate utilization protein LutB